VPRLVFHPDVSTEIRASYSWYQELAEGLGDDFLDELESAYEAILEFPQTWPFFQKGVSKILTF
jgi:toxin ParE1/3/4